MERTRTKNFSAPQEREGEYEVCVSRQGTLWTLPHEILTTAWDFLYLKKKKKMGVGMFLAAKSSSFSKVFYFVPTPRSKGSLPFLFCKRPLMCGIDL